MLKRRGLLLILLTLYGTPIDPATDDMVLLVYRRLSLHPMSKIGVTLFLQT